MQGVSGDFYDFYIEGNKLLGAGVFDVSGHGISSGLVAMLAKWMVFKTFMENRHCELSETFEALANSLPEAIGSTSYYLTGVLLRIEDNTVQYSNAGHPEIIHLSGGRTVALCNADGSATHGSILGIANARSFYQTLTIDLKKNDYLVLYTDGITEAVNSSMEQYGEERFTNILERSYGKSSGEIIDSIIEDLTIFQSNVPTNDDITLLIMKKL